jgi:hypothetical protein
VKPRYLIFLAVMPAVAQTQFLSFGLKGGAPAQTPLGQTFNEMPLVLGPTVNLRISSRFSVETGVLFHRMGRQLNTGIFQYPENTLTFVSSTERGRALELPMLLRYHLLGEHRTWRPFITAGPAVRRTSIDALHTSTVLSGLSLSDFTATPRVNTNLVKWNVDPAFGAGVDLKAGRFHLEPEVRYSYWGAGKNSAVRKNQVDFLLGFRF